MSTLFLLQIALFGLLSGLPNIAFSQLLMCLSEQEMVSGNYRIQDPVGLYTGDIPDGASVLQIYLQPDKDREVFGLEGVFGFERGEEWIAPVFVCEKNSPVWYQLPHYTVACPRLPHEPVQIMSLSMDLFSTERLGLTYWTDSCVAWRRVAYKCVRPKVYPDLPRKYDDGRKWGSTAFPYSPIPDPRQLEVPLQCEARDTVQFKTPIQTTKD